MKNVPQSWWNVPFPFKWHQSNEKVPVKLSEEGKSVPSTHLKLSHYSKLRRNLILGQFIGKELVVWKWGALGVESGKSRSISIKEELPISFELSLAVKEPEAVRKKNLGSKRVKVSRKRQNPGKSPEGRGNRFLEHPQTYLQFFIVPVPYVDSIFHCQHGTYPIFERHKACNYWLSPSLRKRLDHRPPPFETSFCCSRRKSQSSVIGWSN